MEPLIEENPNMAEFSPKGVKIPASSRSIKTDEELEKLLAQQKATIKVVGTGGGGNNTINRITEVGVSGA